MVGGHAFSFFSSGKPTNALRTESAGPQTGAPASSRGWVPLRARHPPALLASTPSEGGTGSREGRAGPQHGGRLALRAGTSGDRGRPAPGCPVVRVSHHGALGSGRRRGRGDAEVRGPQSGTISSVRGSPAGGRGWRGGRGRGRGLGLCLREPDLWPPSPGDAGG